MTTVPIKPEYADISFFAFGIKGPYLTKIDKSAEESYKTACQRRGVIPYSYLKTSKFSLEFGISPEARPLLYRGGKINELSFKVQAFSRFVAEELPALLRENYEISQFNLALTTYHLTGYNQGDYSDTTLKFGVLSHDLELREGSNIAEQDYKGLVEWFKGLKTGKLFETSK